jgi:hypothetical protein
MTEMEQRVAEALMKAWGDPSLRGLPQLYVCGTVAREVIAVMRDPTNDMVACCTGYEDPEKMWMTMIDAAIRSPGPEAEASPANSSSSSDPTPEA